MYGQNLINNNNNKHQADKNEVISYYRYINIPGQVDISVITNDFVLTFTHCFCNYLIICPSYLNFYRL